MDNRFDKLDEKLAEIHDSLTEHRLTAENRLTKLEMKQRGFITICSAIFTGIIAFLVNLFSK